MPKSKHRRKPVRKAVAHPHRDKNHRLHLILLQQDQADRERRAMQTPAADQHAITSRLSSTRPTSATSRSLLVA